MPANAAYTARMAHLATPPQPGLTAIDRAPARLWLPRLSLSRCVRAIVARDTLELGRRHPTESHVNHFPATPLCTIGWALHGAFDLQHADGRTEAVPTQYLTGPFTRPSRSRHSPAGHGMMLMLLPDALQALTGLEPASLVDRIVPAEDVLDAGWLSMLRAVREAPDDAARVALIEAFLEPRWQALRPGSDEPGVLRAHDWAEGLALRAAMSGVGRSLRAAERRIKGWTGLPMRELRGLGRAEQAFFRALDEGEGEVSWADVAADTGYSDQSHLSRQVRRVSGFPPAELRRRIAQDESFWIYRVWV